MGLGKCTVSVICFLFLFSSCLENKEELFNLCHVSLWNVIEHIFGILKKCFQILLFGPWYSIDIQVCIPLVLAATLYNVIHLHKSDEANEHNSDSDDSMGDNLDINGDIGNEASEDGGGLHNRIATDM